MLHDRRQREREREAKEGKGESDFGDKKIRREVKLF
jgi:hypothetical protein